MFWNGKYSRKAFSYFAGSSSSCNVKICKKLLDIVRVKFWAWNYPIALSRYYFVLTLDENSANLHDTSVIYSL